MKEVKIGNYYLSTYESGWTIYSKAIVQKGKRKGQEYTTGQRYYMTLDAAMNRCIEDSAKEAFEKSDDMLGVLNDIKNIKNEAIREAQKLGEAIDAGKK